MRQTDVKTAFLIANFEDEIFNQQPRGFASSENVVCKLSKCIYDLKQASRAWSQFLTKLLSELRYFRSSVDTCLFYHPRKKVSMLCYLIILFDFDKFQYKSCLPTLVSGFALKIRPFPKNFGGKT